ncbi:MAG: hypothetical protein L6R30_14350 [Thermoanaerobaculia bacterium]|nr:hypothetical protein [Thermoanaerobaculia bacterium]
MPKAKRTVARIEFVEPKRVLRARKKKSAVNDAIRAAAVFSNARTVESSGGRSCEKRSAAGVARRAVPIGKAGRTLSPARTAE